MNIMKHLSDPRLLPSHSIHKLVRKNKALMTLSYSSIPGKKQGTDANRVPVLIPRRVEASCPCPHVQGTHGSGIDSLDLRSREHQGSSISCWHESTSKHTLLLISVICPLTICTYIIWGSSGPNKSHVLITFEGVMTSGQQPIFIWFQSKGQRTGYASDTFQLSSSPFTCLLCFYFREPTLIFSFS